MNTALAMATAVIPSVASCAIWECLKTAHHMLLNRGSDEEES